MSRSLANRLPAVPGIAKSTRDTDLEVLASSRIDRRRRTRTTSHGMHDYLSTKFRCFDTRARANAVCSISTDITERSASNAVWH
ncbi:MAG: hypothetical protein H6958_02060 [Chromatiaceae bacterium]|nr:hypothetical protein [Chromatiaceae bacterium]